jgi:hypothetical protein
MIANGTLKGKKLAQSKTKTINTSLSFEPDLLDDAKTIARLAGFTHSFSAYVADLIRKDIEWRTTGRNQRLAQLASL